MVEKNTKAQKLAHLEHIATSEDRFFHDYTPDIETYLVDEDPEVRVRAVECLWEYPEPAYIDVLIHLAENDPSDEVRRSALSGLGIYIHEGEFADYDFDWGQYDELMREDELPQADFERVRDYLLGVIRDDSWPADVRRFAIEAISPSQAPEVLSIIEQAYHHADPTMKVSAVFAMGQNGNPRWEDYVLEALCGSVPELEYEAVRAAGFMSLDRANRQLMRIAEGAEDKALRIAAIWSLGEIGHEMAFALLDDLQFDSDKDIREAAEEALDEWMMSAHLREFDDEDFLDEDVDWDGDGWLN